MLTFSSLGSIAAVGGIVALISAGWGHAKTIFNHLSSVLIVRASSSYQINTSVYMHLRRHWRLVPSNAIEYKHLWMRVNGSNDQKCVPFKMPNSTSTIFVKGWRFVVYHPDGKFWSLRGMLNLDQLVSTAVVEWRDSSRINKRRESSYRVIQVMGEEKGMGAFAAAGTAMKRANSTLDEASSDSPAGGGFEPMPEIDTALIYSRESLVRQDLRNPFDQLFYEPHVYRAVESAQTWFDNEEWYEKRGLPWRLGWLLSGPPGTGKSALVQAIGETLGVRVYVFNLATLSDQEFRNEWANMNTPCVAAFEDFDTVFEGRENKTAHKSLSFDTLLNVLSGVQTRSGVFLMVTTNHPEKLDSAMGTAPRFDEIGLSSAVSTRPGRLDVEIHLGHMGRDNRLRMANKTLSDWPDLHADVMTLEGEFTPAQFQEICTQRALARIAEERRNSVDRPTIEVHSIKQAA